MRLKPLDDPRHKDVLILRRVPKPEPHVAPLVMPPGKTCCLMVEMPDTSTGGILLTDDSQANMRPDLAQVVAVADDVPLSIGEIVLVKWGHGKRIVGVQAGAYRAPGELRFYGVAGGVILDNNEIGEPHLKAREVDWDASIMASVDLDTMEVRPVGRNVRLLLDPREEESQGGILIAEAARPQPPVATVLNWGDRAFKEGRYAGFEIFEGDRVQFAEGAIHGSYAHEGQRFVIVPDWAILGVMNG